ncbi:hypothetical protein NIB75_16160 [Bacteroides uniformis]|nr:hypothetical protein [Bacteroides uniformis]
MYSRWGFGCPDVNPAVIYVGVGRIAVVEIGADGKRRTLYRQSRFDSSTSLSCANSRAIAPTVRMFYPYVVRTVPCFLVQHDASPLFLNIVHITESNIITANIGKDKMQTNYTVGFILLKFL